MFVCQAVSVDTGFPAARARLAELIRDGLLERASTQAYGEQVAALIRVGPLGAVPGLSRLVRVQMEDLQTTEDSTVLALRWETEGPGAVLFPALDADLRLSPAAENISTLTLTGAYRPPLGTTGELLDRAVMHRVTTATIRAFLRHLATALACATGPAGTQTATC